MERYCLECKLLLNPKGKNLSYQKYCSRKCAGKQYDRKRLEKRKPYLRIKSLEYYYKNRIRVLEKQNIYIKGKYFKDKKYKEIYNIRRKSAHSSSLKDKKCYICNTTKDLQRHHPDYSKPKEIIILCRKCHNIKHQSG